MNKLAADLRPIYHLELALGNEVHYVAEPAAMECPLCVVFKQRLHCKEIDPVLRLPPTVTRWENHDTHYPLGAGFQCAATRHCVAGSL